MKAHLLDSDEPLKQGPDYKANCGVVVPNAIFAFIVDGGTFYMKPLLFCTKCSSGDSNKRYVYGLVDGASVEASYLEII